MPRIPLSTDTGPSGLNTLGIPQPEEEVRRGQIQIAELQSVGRAIRQIGGVIGEAGIELRRRQRRTEINNESLKAKEHLLITEAELRREILQDPEISNMDKSSVYLERLGEISDEVLEGLQHDASRFSVRESALSLARNGKLSLDRESARAQNAELTARINNLVDQAALRAERGESLEGIEEDLDQALDLALAFRSDEEIEETRQNIAERLQGTMLATEARALVAEQGPRALESLQAEASERFPALSMEKVGQVLAVAGREGRDQRVIALDRRIERGVATLEEIEALADSGDLAPSERGARVRRLENVIREQIDVSRNLARVQSVIDGEGIATPTNADYRKAVDDYFATFIAPQLAELPPDQQLGEITRFAASTLVIPSGVKERLVGSLRSLSGENALLAAEQIETLVGVAPTLVKDFSERDLSTAELINAFRAGDRDTAVERAREVLSQGQGVREQRRQELRELLKEEGSNEDFLREEASEVGAFSFLPFAGTDVEIPSALSGEFDALVRASYERHGDLGVARDAALKALQRTWGVTRVGGESRWMKLAPEVVYGQKGGGAADAEWIQSDLETELARVAPDVDPEEVRLVSDVFTGRVGSPSYALVHVTEDGPDPLRAESGQPLRFTPDPEGSPTLQRERQERIEEAKTRRSLGVLLGKLENAIERLQQPVAPLPRPGESFETARERFERAQERGFQPASDEERLRRLEEIREEFVSPILSVLSGVGRGISSVNEALNRLQQPIAPFPRPGESFEQARIRFENAAQGQL